MISKNQVKYIQSLGQKKRRDEEGLFIAEGPKIVAELLAEPGCHIKLIYALNNWISGNNLNILPEVMEITEKELEKISQLKTPNQVLVVAEKMNWEGEASLKNTITLVLDTIQDPGNMGTIIRLADWFGVKQIICSYECADIYNPKVVQSSMGSIVRVRVDYFDLKDYLKKYKDIPVYAAALDGNDISAMKKIQEGIIIIGNESKGISDDLLEEVNTKITIVGKGKAESLNAAIATGIILSHLT